MPEQLRHGRGASVDPPVGGDEEHFLARSRLGRAEGGQVLLLPRYEAGTYGQPFDDAYAAGAEPAVTVVDEDGQWFDRAHLQLVIERGDGI